MPLPTLRTSPHAYHVPAICTLPALVRSSVQNCSMTPAATCPACRTGKATLMQAGLQPFHMTLLSWEIPMTSPGHCGYTQHPLDDARWEDIKLFWTHTSQVRKYGASKIKTHYLTGNGMLQRAKITGIGSTPKLNRKCSSINIRF